MNKLTKGLLTMLGIFGAIAEMIEILFFPIVFLIVGLLQQFPWQYYAITIGGYFAIMIVSELILHLIFKALGKKYSSRFVRKAEKVIARFSKDADHPPAKDN